MLNLGEVSPSVSCLPTMPNMFSGNVVAVLYVAIHAWEGGMGVSIPMITLLHLSKRCWQVVANVVDCASTYVRWVRGHMFTNGSLANAVPTCKMGIGADKSPSTGCQGAELNKSVPQH